MADESKEEKMQGAVITGLMGLLQEAVAINNWLGPDVPLSAYHDPFMKYFHAAGTTTHDMILGPAIIGGACFLLSGIIAYQAMHA